MAKKKILAVGGGSGGHVTPVVAVLRTLREQEPDAELRFWCDTGFAKQARAILDAFDPTLPMSTIVAGRLRRYHHLTLWQQLTWPSLVAKNARDMFLVLVGVVQSFFKLLFWRPDVVFTKGGFVCLPVGFAAYLLRIPLVIHDSDAHPGLTNRILSRWATAIATGAPLEHYPYDPKKSTYVGIPIGTAFVPPTEQQQRTAKQEWGVAEDRPLLVVTGGGLGATRINDTIVKVKDALRDTVSIILVSGSGQYEELRAQLPENDTSFQLHAFVTRMPSLLTAADVVVARAGATTILELAALAKPTILVPNAKLTGGHQLKNAAVYQKADAVVIVDEDQMLEQNQLLISAVESIVANPDSSREMAERFHAFSKPHAAVDMAEIVLSALRS
jgi:UDP-N-acetylglucosamine--N-acetylmuramyl-(pentapeptide) pyrophosphoryl-undecaprenol N-acetylglucosamine transferase